MDTIIACKYVGGVIIAADSSQARSIMIYKNDLDKIAHISDSIMMGSAGPNADTVQFSEFVQRNVKLYELSNDGIPMSTKACANFCRGELSKALRRGPFQTNVMLGGYDKKSNSESLYYIDYMGTLQEVNFGVQGYASSFTLSIFDREWKEGMTEDEAYTGERAKRVSL